MLHLNHSPRFTFPRITGVAAVLLALPFAVACGAAGDESMDSGGSAEILSNTPFQDATEVPTNGYIGAVFRENMDGGERQGITLTLRSGATVVPGTAIYANSMVEFWPAVRLASDTMFTATITEGMADTSGEGMKVKHIWSFTTGKAGAMAPIVNLGTAGNYVILSKAGISTVPQSAITGNLAVSPAAASYITGFSLIADPTNTFSTSTQVTGKVYAANYAAPTPSALTTAVNDMQLAFTSAAARAPDVIELGGGNIGGMTISPGVYKWSTGVMIPTNVTLSGNSKGVWIFQIAQNLTISNAAKITLAGGGLPKKVFWQVSGAVSLGTTAQLVGVVLSQTSIGLNTSASLNGRLLAQTAVTLDANTVVQPAN